MGSHFRENPFNTCGWYPPAEVKVPVLALLSALWPGDADFQDEISKYLGVEYCVCAGSARFLLAQILQALWKRTAKQRNEVLIPGYTCYSVAASVVRAGFKIQVYDIDPKTFHPNLDSVKRSLNERTLAMVTQHLFGIPTPVGEMNSIAGGEGAFLIEDAAQSMGACLNGYQTGTIGDFGFYSFGRGKPLPLGYGGALVGKEATILRDVALPSNRGGHGQLLFAAAVQMLSHKRLYGLMETLPLGLGDTIFNPEFSISSMPVTVKKIGKKAIRSLKVLNDHRRAIAEIYTEILEEYGVVSVQKSAYPIYTRFPYIGYTGKIPPELKRLGVRRMYPKALVDEPAIKKYFVDTISATPGASRIAEKLITLPTHMGITRALAEQIASKLRMYLGQ